MHKILVGVFENQFSPGVNSQSIIGKTLQGWNKQEEE